MNEDNLRVLAMLLRTHAVQEHFDMRYFSLNQKTAHERKPNQVQTTDYNECGTVACALGHAPLIFKPIPDDTNWAAYCQRVFDLDNHSNEWRFLFAPGWAGVDNTPLGAAKRIEYLLDNPAPSSRDQNDMMMGRIPLCYA